MVIGSSKARKFEIQVLIYDLKYFLLLKIDPCG
jgi:hypothetical protein